MENLENLYRLKTKLIKNIGDYADSQLTSGVVDVIQKASSAAKDICKIIEACEEEEEGYSQRGGSYRNSYAGESGRDEGGSYARGRRRAPRDSMGRYSGYGYSRDGYSRHSGQKTAEEIRALMSDAPDDETRREMERLVKMLEQR